MATKTADAPTRWDMSNVFSSLEGDDYLAARKLFEADLAAFESLLAEKQIARGGNADKLDDAALAALLEEVIARYNALSLSADTLESFVYAYHSTDSYDDTASRELSRLEILGTRQSQLSVRIAGWIGSLSDRLPQVIANSQVLKEHKFYLTDTAEQSRYLMDDELEALAAELCVDGGQAFGKLQGNVTSQLKVPFERDGKEDLLPITVIRNFSYDADPEIRERAYHTELAGWKSIRTSIAASLNAVKGTAISLARRRGRSSVLETALVSNRVDQETLDAMMGAISDAFPVFRRYLKCKAGLLRHEQLPWWDLFAPLGEERHFSWREARDFIVEKFGSFTAELADYAATAFDENWIDGGPRDGKRGGAFCMPVPGVEQSRVLANFDGSFEQVSTLAHELGHGFHNHCQRGLPMLRRGSPSTLAETASIFCETLVAQAALKEATPQQQRSILEVQLSGATQVCLDISSRFLFESRFIQRRGECELSPDEICDLMTGAQRETYAEAVQEATYHPYMWLWKPHYYSHEEHFYNFPYAFGHLFGLGLYAVYQQQGEEFVPSYKELLRDTGQDYARALAKRFDIDIAAKQFWQDSLAVIQQQVARYESL